MREHVQVKAGVGSATVEEMYVGEASNGETEADVMERCNSDSITRGVDCQPWLVAASVIFFKPEDPAAAASWQPEFYTIICVPQAEVYQSLTAMDEKIATSEGTVIGITIGGSFLTAIIVTALIRRTTSNLVKPLRQMVSVATSINEQVADKQTNFNEVEVKSILEPENLIGDLVREFKKLVLDLGGKKEGAATIKNEAKPPKENPFRLDAEKRHALRNSGGHFVWESDLMKHIVSKNENKNLGTI